MQKTPNVTVSARVPPRTLQLAKAAADLCGATLSSFVAQAIAEAARRELNSDPGDKCDVGTGTSPAPRCIQALG